MFHYRDRVNLGCLTRSPRTWTRTRSHIWPATATLDDEEVRPSAGRDGQDRDREECAAKFGLDLNALRIKPCEPSWLISLSLHSENKQSSECVRKGGGGLRPIVLFRDIRLVVEGGTFAQSCTHQRANVTKDHFIGVGSLILNIIQVKVTPFFTGSILPHRCPPPPGGVWGGRALVLCEVRSSRVTGNFTEV